MHWSCFYSPPREDLPPLRGGQDERSAHTRIVKGHGLGSIPDVVGTLVPIPFEGMKPSV